jgi:hypothetical protein
MATFFVVDDDPDIRKMGFAAGDNIAKPFNPPGRMPRISALRARTQK